MNTEKLVLAALKEKNPALHKELAQAGTLRAFVEERAEEISDAVGTLTMELAPKQGYKQAKSLPEAAGILKACEATAKEIVFAEMLEFPQDDSERSGNSKTA